MKSVSRPYLSAMLRHRNSWQLPNKRGKKKCADLIDLSILKTWQSISPTTRCKSHECASKCRQYDANRQVTSMVPGCNPIVAWKCLLSTPTGYCFEVNSLPSSQICALTLQFGEMRNWQKNIMVGQNPFINVYHLFKSSSCAISFRCAQVPQEQAAGSSLSNSSSKSSTLSKVLASDVFDASAAMNHLRLKCP